QEIVAGIVRNGEAAGGAFLPEGLDLHELEPGKALDESADRIRQDIVGQLVHGRGFDRSAVDAYANQVAAVFRTLGQRTGRDPFSIYQPYQLRISRPASELLRVLPKTDEIDLALDR